MLSIPLILAAIVTLGASGLPAYLFSPRSRAGQRIGTALMASGGVLGSCGVALSLIAGTSQRLSLPWHLPGEFAVNVDPLGLVFLGLVFIVPALGSAYGLGYWKQSEHVDDGRRLGLFYGLLAASMAMVVIAANAVLFLIAWEAMALSAFFASTVDADNPETRRSGWIYLIATHVGTLCLLAMFAMWKLKTGSFALSPAAAMEAGAAGTIFALAGIGFGFKAGIMPLHLWLPGAHANAPSHVSAVMSGVMLKMGVYGIMRMTSLLPVPAEWWGIVLLVVGAFSGVVGIAFAMGQRDLKRVLAYSSIENIGIIFMGLGLALLGRTYGRLDWIALGLGGSLFHVWNHGLFKPLLFLNSGAIIHAGHTRDIEKLGGLSKLMPMTAALFFVGAIAICALPPFNGFASEWLLYLGFFSTLGPGIDAAFAGAAVAAVALSLIGALAVACFVRLAGTVFSGEPRTVLPGRAHDPDAAMIVPMIILAAACALSGLFPAAAAPVLDAAVRAWASSPDTAVFVFPFVPMQWITWIGIGLVACVCVLAVLLRLNRRAKAAAKGPTWDCGYALPGASMQYTGSSFGHSIVKLFSFALFPVERKPVVRNAFPRSIRYASDVPDVVLDRMLPSLLKLAKRFMPKFRVLQQGQMHFYLLYVVAITIALLCFGGIK